MNLQTPLVPNSRSIGLSEDQSAILRDTLIIPPSAAVLSATVLLAHALFIFDPQDAVVTRPDSLRTRITQHVNHHGGCTIYAYMAARLLGSLALLVISSAPIILGEVDTSSLYALAKGGKQPKHQKSRPVFAKQEWLHVFMILTFFYTFSLALISVTAKRRCSKIVIRHLNTVFFVTLCVYCYRDIFPYATFTLYPLDISEGSLLWVKIAILVLTAIVVPLAIPRLYIPVDPKNPMVVPNPELTASIFSMAVHHYLNSLVFRAYRIPHLPFEQLPPLSDHDFAAHLKDKSFKYLDVFSGAKKRHLFFGLLLIFRQEYLVMSAMLVLYVICSFAAPVGIYQLLHYIEVKGEGAIVRPWVWIIWLFIGPVFGCITFQWYIFIATRTLVRAEAIIMELVFEHALRIRVKAEITEPKLSTSTTATPDVQSIVESSHDDSSNNSGDATSHTISTTDEVSSNEEETLQASSASTTSTSWEGKSKANDSHDSRDGGKNLVGKINNLVTTDLVNIVNGRDFLFLILYIPAQISLCICFLYFILGWSAFVGLAVILIMFPVPGYVANLVQKVQKQRMKRTDARVQFVTEAMNVLRMIKLFGWEAKINDRIADKRDEELVWMKYRQYLELLNGTLNYVIPILTMIATFATYVLSLFFTLKLYQTIVMKQDLSASKVFSSISVFDMLRDQLHTVFYAVTQSMTGKVSLDRVTAFLRETELLDSFSDKHESETQFETALSPPSDVIGFRNAVFAWSDDSGGSQTPSGRGFLLRIEEKLEFKRGAINLIVGSTGSGKTSLLHALLGEMHFVPSGLDSWYNLPRNDGIAYAAQESWVLNETIKDNIVFGSEFDKARYKSVLQACQLERDLELFDAGDQTEVGEKGLTLSGGQKARITLARAIYSRAGILLLDDVLAALDVHTSKAIIEDCFKGPLVKGRTVILVTHNVALARPIAEYLVVISDGRIRRKGSISEVLAKEESIAVVIKEEQEKMLKVEEQVDSQVSIAETQQSSGKLIIAEEIEEGHIGWPALRLYLAGLGGSHVYIFFLAFLGSLVLVEFLSVMQTWYLGYWASRYEMPASEINVFYYLGVYGSLLLVGTILHCFAYIIFVFGAIRASRSIHKQLVEVVSGTTLRWLDRTPISRIITRCTQDISAVDGPIANMLFFLTQMTLNMLGKFGAVIIITPVFLVPGLAITLVGGWIGQVYIKAQLSVKREMSNAKSPVLGHIGAAIAGLTSIRAYGVQQRFTRESLRRIDNYVRTARTFYNLNRWVCIRIEAAGGLFAASLATYLLYFQDKESSTTGFSLNMAVGFSGMILWWVRVLNEFEVQGNSLERIQRYVKIEQEPKSTDEGRPPAYWPASGELRVQKLSARYSPDGPNVLHDLSFKINSGERIGVVGRTGSGKSSLTLSLLRCIFTDGTVHYDGVLTSEINLDALRSSITIIPQVPELLSGSLRQNLDPFEQHDDATLNNALRSAGLFALQSEMEEGNALNLDSSIASGGANLSIGQRQILALARAIARGSKLLILDEATSAIDHKTDTIIQSSLRHELKGDVTLITIAHRLQTIMDADRIMVLDSGRIVEFDSPKELLKKKHGKLRSLVDESADKDLLYVMASGESIQSTP